jgi:hypothetical protein
MTDLPLLENVKLVGAHFDSVKHILELYKVRFRVSRWHGQHQVLTMDYMPRRYNLEVNKEGIVEKITFG